MVDDIISETKNLTKEFNGFTAVNDVNLQMQCGHTHASIGPNGAGVREILDGVLSRVSLLRHTSLMLPERPPQGMKEIATLLRSISKHDVSGARAMSQKHVENAEKAALGVFRKQFNTTSTNVVKERNKP